MTLPERLALRRLADTDSIADLTDLLHRAYAELAEMGLRYFATHQGEADTRHRISKGECWVADLDGRVVATIVFMDTGRTRGSPWYDRPDVSSFAQFAVEPSLKRRGIGSALLALVEERARATGAAELACDTAEDARHLIDMYERRGYRRVESVDWRPVTNYLSVILSKALPSRV